MRKFKITDVQKKQLGIFAFVGFILSFVQTENYLSSMFISACISASVFLAFIIENRGKSK